MSWLAAIVLVIAQAGVPAAVAGKVDPKVAAQVPVIRRCVTPSRSATWSRPAH